MFHIQHCKIVTTPTQPQLNSKVGCDTQTTLSPPPTPPPTPQIQCHQYLSCSWPNFNQTLMVGLRNQQQQHEQQQQQQ